MKEAKRYIISLKQIKNMEKIYGATERADSLTQTGQNKWDLIYGFGEENETTYQWHKRFTEQPTENDIKNAVFGVINKETDAKILSGFVWNGMNVYLSTENQFNFKAAYDMAEMTDGKSLPVRFKLGEDENGKSVYHEFTTMTDFRDFYSSAMAHINATLNEGWEAKDSVDFSVFGL